MFEIRTADLKQLDKRNQIAGLILSWDAKSELHILHVRLTGVDDKSLIVTARNTPRKFPNLNAVPTYLQNNCPKFLKDQQLENKHAVELFINSLEQQYDSDIRTKKTSSKNQA